METSKGSESTCRGDVVVDARDKAVGTALVFKDDRHGYQAFVIVSRMILYKKRVANIFSFGGSSHQRQWQAALA